MSSRDAVRSQPANFARAFAGKRPAASAAATRSPKPVSLATSSIKITSPGGWILTFRSEEHTSELQSLRHLVCRLLLEKKKKELLEGLLTSEDVDIRELYERFGSPV